MSRAGSVHNPTFKASACVNGDTFEGTGQSKRKAKLQLAINAVKSLGLNQPSGELVLQSVNDCSVAKIEEEEEEEISTESQGYFQISSLGIKIMTYSFVIFYL